MFQEIRNDTNLLIENSEETIMLLCLKSFKSLIRSLFEKVKEEPRNILKRLDNY